LRSARATWDFGVQFADRLDAGSVVILEGPLGAGKTTLAQGLAYGLGVTETVTSPTFALVHEYRGRLEVFHMDLYRLASEEEFDLIGGWEYFRRGGVCIIEWAERLGSALTAPRWVLRLSLLPRGRGLAVSQEGAA
jgi:tRNA threonylcarbamoyladenosine biosynthesis protein TsaE